MKEMGLHEPYEGLHQAYQTIIRWIEEQDLIIVGPDRENLPRLFHFPCHSSVN